MKRSTRNLTFAVLALSLSAAAAVHFKSKQRNETSAEASGELEAMAATRAFSAALFPYIPDSGNDQFATLIAALESGFESANPEIDLQITIDPNMNLYDFGELATLLGTGTGSFNMVEVDTLLLGDLVTRNLVQSLPFDIGSLGFLPTAVEAATMNSVIYAVPTYLCGNYIYSWDPGIRDVPGGQELIDFLSQQPDPSATPLIGNFKGSWTLPGFYLDAWADTHTNDPTQVAGAYDLPLDPPTMGIFPPVVDLCGNQGGPCLTGTYKDNTLAETQFAQNQANGLVVYSERLYYVLTARGGNVNLPSVISAPLGTGSRPEMFVDGLVLNTACTGQCATDAATFSSYMSSLQVRNLIAFSQDVTPKTFPRYLLQALAAFYTSPPGSQNLIYQQIFPYIQQARALPNEEFPQKRHALDQALQIALTGSAVEMDASPVGKSVGGVEIRHAPARFPHRPRQEKSQDN